MALRAALRSRSGLSGLLSQRSSCSSDIRMCVSPLLVPQQRNYSTPPKIRVEFDQSTGVAVMHMQSPPVNSLSLDFLTELCISVEKLEMDKSCRGLIITSAQPKVFSAGLDITEMYGKSPEHCGAFWRSVQEMWLKLYGSNMVTVAAINVYGHHEEHGGPADHRDRPSAGLLYKPADALKIGLVDQLEPEDQVIAAATQTISRPCQTDHQIHDEEENHRQAHVNRESDIQYFVNFITKDSIQKSLGGYMEMLKKRRA
ncbi:hypothetical protein F7725_004050 [Dissostichus mawsoni]|uniref:Uncharacterized protein n=1 Tax=Dissostichus mawsoni TaxID=36200 RepID=A0A7J5YBY3_DISMA|nr:hypothetical protein F7725_004050 [Dissostichus mawsoni]